MTETDERPVATSSDLSGPGEGRHRSAPRHPGLALVVISLTQLIVVLDAAIVNVALPSIQRALHFSEANLIWVINGYTLAFGGLLLLGGRTGDLFGRRRMFLIGVGLFTVGVVPRRLGHLRGVADRCAGVAGGRRRHRRPDRPGAHRQHVPRRRRRATGPWASTPRCPAAERPSACSSAAPSPARSGGGGCSS